MALCCSPGISSTVYFVQSWLSFKMLICLCHEFFLNHFNLIEVFAFPESKWSFAPFQLIFHLSILILIFLFFFLWAILSCSFVGRDFALYDFILSPTGLVWKQISVHSTVWAVLKSYNEIFIGHSVDIFLKIKSVILSTLSTACIIL